ncbi:MAG: hypothetical protein HC904_00775 [Blastochloris sp.]|nr:hypothetical protein [Blastochloris sp.]
MLESKSTPGRCSLPSLLKKLSCFPQPTAKIPPSIPPQAIFSTQALPRDLSQRGLSSPSPQSFNIPSCPPVARQSPASFTRITLKPASCTGMVEFIIA